MPFAGAGAAAAGLAAAVEVFGLNKSPSVNLAGDADAAGLSASLAAVSVLAFLRPRFSTGEAEAAAVLSAAGEGEVAGIAFRLRVRFSAGEGEAAASAAGEGEVAGVAFRLRVRFSAGEGEAAASAADEAALVASAFL